MTHIHEKEIAEQIDRDVRATDGLIALVACLSVTVGLVVAGAITLIGAI
jgi:hypothetical protein